MARIRTIKPEFWTDSFMVQLPHFGRLFYIALWSAADDQGYLPDEPERLAMILMPREDPLLVDEWIQFFISHNKLERYVAGDSSTFLKLTNWHRHQKVDNPSKSRVCIEGSRKLSIPNAVRIALAEKYGCEPGKKKQAECFYCGVGGVIVWHRLYSGKPSRGVSFSGFEIDHVTPENEGVKGVIDNLVLACRQCNRSKGTKYFLDLIDSGSIALASPIEDSCMDQGPRIKDQGRDGTSDQPAADPCSDFVLVWNSTTGATKIRKLTDKRRSSLRARLSEPDWDWRAALAKFPLKCFASEPDGYVPDIEFFIRPDTVTKILEGKYDWHKSGSDRPQTPRSQVIEGIPDGT